MIRWILVFIAFLTPSIYSQEDYPDPFGEDTDEELLVPRKASFFKHQETVKGITIIAKVLPQLLGDSFGKEPFVRKDHEQLPHSKKGDVIYDISGAFPNCEGKPDLWVAYNATSCYVIASADPLLRASVNEYVSRAVMTPPIKMRLSITYLKVASGVPLEMEALRRLDTQKLISFSGEFRSGEETTIQQKHTSVYLEPIFSQNYEHSYLSLSLFRENEYDVDVDVTLLAGKETIAELGIYEGGEKGVLILKLECIDLLGRSVDFHTPRRVEKMQNDFKEISSLTQFGVLCKGLIELLGDKDPRIIAPPHSPLFKSDDVVYDLTSYFKNQGIKFDDNQWLIYNNSTYKLYSKISDEAYEQILEFFYCGISYPVNITTGITFYEVNQREVNSVKWDAESLLAAHPKLLGRVAFISPSGYDHTLSSSNGSAEAKTVRGEGNYHIFYEFEFDLNMLERELKASSKVKCRRNEDHYVEISTNTETKRSIVMIVKSRDWRVKYEPKPLSEE